MIYTHKTEGYTLRDFHWMIEDYVECIKKSGLVVEEIVEPMPVPESKERNPELYEMKVKFPQYLVFVCKS